jgi:thymidylate synthase
MEAIWMMAGHNDVRELTPFNKRMAEYADEDILAGAYGHRWINHFGLDQVDLVIRELRENPISRRAVVAMWDPSYDWTHNGKDRPCNTMIHFRLVQGRLTMFVMNRSNDLVWGMLGANVVHMTMLQEVVAHFVGAPLGRYHVISTNAHIYQNTPGIIDMMAHGWASIGPYDDPAMEIRPMLGDDEYMEWTDFSMECDAFLREKPVRGHFLGSTATHMRNAYRAGKDWRRHVERIYHNDWRAACTSWMARHRG